jgi:molecular chaperone GrpE
MGENLPIHVDRPPRTENASVEAEWSEPERWPDAANEMADTIGDREGARAPEAGSEEAWRDRTLRLQAQMENYRKRQRRLAEEEIMADRERLLRLFLIVADDLERALAAQDADVESLRQGVSLTYQTLMRLIGQEGVESVGSVGDLFDPVVHEAIDTVPHETVVAQVARAEPGRVVAVVRQGYRLGNRLLRPAKVIVAV